MDVNKLCGWLGEYEARAAWEYMRERFPEFKIIGETEYKRTCAWDAWEELGFDINRSTLYKQEIGDCLHGDVFVLGETIKQIKDVEVGDVVYDGRGRLTTVISKQAKSVAGPLWEIDCYGTIPTKVTGDHKILIMRPSLHEKRPVTTAALEQAERNGRWRSLKLDDVKARLDDMSPMWIRADNLQAGDYLLSPEEFETIPLPDGFPIKLDADGLWLVGMFLANGNATRRGKVSICFHEDAVEDIQRAIAIFESNGYSTKAKKFKGRRATTVDVNNVGLSDVFHAEFYTEDKFKNYPGWAIGRMEVAEGLFDGDGCDIRNGRKLVSISRSIIHGLEATLIGNGFRVSTGVVSVSKSAYPNAKPQYSIIVADKNGESIRKDWGKFRHCGYYARKVRRISPIEGWDVVYDIGVESKEHSFIGNGVVKSNCVSFGAAIAVAAVMAHEIVRDGEWEKFHCPFPPYLYGISRCMPEGGNGRLGNSDGSLGSWMADTIIKYGVLREDYEGVPKYSGGVAKQWGASRRAFDQFVDEADNHLMKTAAPVRSADELRDALCNGYYCTIASNRGFSMQLKDEKGKSWFVGRDSWAHQMSYIAYDEEPEPCVYIRNQWGTAHGRQQDGPDGGGWRRLADEDSFLRSSGVECFAFSRFDGFPSEKEKPRNWFA